MKLLDIKATETSGLYCEEGLFESARGKRHTVHFTMPADYARPRNNDHFALYGVSAAFVLNEDYAQAAPMDAKLLKQLQDVLGIWKGWYGFKHLTKIGVTPRSCAQSDRLPKSKGAHACLFTAGVDSLFTVLRQREALDALLSVIHLPDGPASFQDEQAKLADFRRFADRLGMNHLVVATNVMTALPEYQDAWAHLSHGAAYAAAAHFLSGELSHATISSSLTWSQLMPWGSHPDTDWRFGGSELMLDHFGTSTSRIDKTAAIAAEPELLEMLNVCSRGRRAVSDYINCSKCQKCLRTMLALDLAGIAPERASAFDWSGYAPANIEKIYLRTRNEYLLFEEIRERALALGRDDVVAPVERLIRRSRRFVALTTAEMAVRKRLTSVVRIKRIAMRVRGAIYRFFGLRTRLGD